MDPGLKQRLIGAAVLIALAVIFLPMLVQGPAPDSGVSDLSLHVPDAPDGEYVTRDLPLVAPEAAGSTGLLASDGRLATVDTATATPEGDARHADAADLAADPAAEPIGAADVAVPDAAEAAEVAALPPEPAAPPRPIAAATDTAPRPVAPAPAKPDPVATQTPAPAPRLPAATAGGDYAVNFGAYATRADAGTVVQRLRGEDLPAYVEETRVGGRDAWRVRIGPYASRADAETARVRAGAIGSRATAVVVALDAAAPASGGTPGASTTAPAAATAPAPAAGTGFAVQLGAFGSARDATALRDRLRGAGIGAFTETVQTDRGTLTRVKAGPVATRAEAEQLKARVKSGFGIDGLVRSHP
ncbi:SPOR domain-containing protein [Luteimonas granuli]|uniref:Sporulation protein n=1 Tax=Luteimonas granuli TaxID=1176533 RepID=A0A518N603_9GAMM|nr:SPOR domain-containing protein [Luteimonas granuli]QDW67342.1 sporulation protein [Luteimonas granuli]